MAEETVKIESDDFEGGVIINKADFDDKIHTLFVEPEPKGKNLVDDDDDEDDDEEDWTLSKLKRLKKDDLIAEAKRFGLVYLTPDDVNRDTIANEILDAQGYDSERDS